MVFSKIKNKLRIYYIQSKELLSSRAKKASSTETDFLKSYSCANISDQNPDNWPKQIIYMADGKLKHGGLADRLRGIITLYDYCKKHNIEFKIHFVSPFQLKDFLEPSGYDWTINPDDITYDSNYSHPVFLDTYAWEPKMEKLYERIVAKIKLKQHYRQLHVYTNYLYAENKFGELFNELFTPSKTLQSYLDNEYKKLSGEYISISTRFLNILGDFNETYQGHEYLTPDEKTTLIETCICEIKKIQKENPGKIALVTSDSISFLKKVKEQVDCHIIEGNISHIDADNADNSATFKTFLDFFMIANAAKSYLIIGRGMLNSNFSKRAAAINNHPFIIRHV